MLESAKSDLRVFRASYRCFLHHIPSWSAGVQSHKHCLSHFPAGELLPVHFVPQEPEHTVSGHCRNYVQNVAPAMGKASSIFQVCLQTQAFQRVSSRSSTTFVACTCMLAGWRIASTLIHNSPRLLHGRDSEA